MAEKIEIFTLKIDVDEAISQTALLKEETDQLKRSYDATAKSTTASTEEVVKSEAAYKNSNTQYKASQRELQKLIQIQGKEVKTVEQGRQALSVINKEWAKQASLYGANSKQADKLAKKSLELRNRLKELEAGVGDNTRNVGNYTESMSKAIGQNTAFGRSMSIISSTFQTFSPVIKGVKNEINGVSQGFKNATASTVGMTKAQKASTIATALGSAALKIFKIALISTGIGILIVALGSLVSYFSKTQRGVDVVSKAMAGLGAAVDVIVDRLSALGEAISNLFSGGGLAAFFTEVGDAAAGMGDEMAREVAIAVELEEAFQKMEDKEISLIGTQEARRQKIEELRFAAKDELLDINKRAELLQQAGDLEKAILQDDLSIAKERARISDERTNQGESSRDEIRENAELQADLSRKEAEALKKRRTLEAEKQSLLKRGRAEEEKNANAAIAAAKKVTDQALKDNDTRLKLFIEQNKGKTKVLEEGLTFFKDVADRETEIALEKYEAGKLNEIEYQLTLLEIKNGSLEAQAELTKKFADAEIEKEKERLELKKETEAEELEIKKEKDLIEFEAVQETRLAQGEWEFNVLRSDLERQKKEELDNANKVGADTTLIEKKYAAYSKAIKVEEQNAKLSAVSDTFGAVADLLGKETAAGKAAAIAQTTIQTYLGAQQAFTSLSVIPIVGPILGGIAAAAAVAAGLINIRKIVSTPKPTIPKAESGALFGVGGKRHYAGGTKFRGEDGTTFEAEKGELIGVMNRRAAASFMEFNDAHLSGSSRGQNYFADGGIVDRSILSGVTPSSVNVASSGIDYDLLALKVAEANGSLPAPVVIVEEINEGQTNLAEVVEGASV